MYNKTVTLYQRAFLAFTTLIVQEKIEDQDCKKVDTAFLNVLDFQIVSYGRFRLAGIFATIRYCFKATKSWKSTVLCRLEENQKVYLIKSDCN